MTNHLLLTNGYIHSVAEPYANAIHIDNTTIAWLGSDDAAQQMVAATVTDPVTNIDLNGALVTPAFIDGFSTTPLHHRDSRIMFSTVTPGIDGVFYRSLSDSEQPADGIFVPVHQLGELQKLVPTLKPPTQVLIESSHDDDLGFILEQLQQQPKSALMRSRHRIVLNHTVSERHITSMLEHHISVTVVPKIVEDQPVFHAPVASFIAAGIQVATGTGEWSGSIWRLLTALIEHDDADQRITTRAAFNTMSRDGIRVLPSKLAQEHMAAGHITAGAPADLNIWRAEQLGVQAPNEKSAHWSTDERAGSALLPILSSTDQEPKLEHLLRNGRIF